MSADNKSGVHNSQTEDASCSNVLRGGVFIGFGILFIVMGIVLSPSLKAIKEGIGVLLTTNAHLDTATFYIVGEASIGAPFIVSGILGIIVMISYFLTGTQIKGGAIAALFMVMGFAFCGKTFLNVWPTFFGVLLYAAVNKKKISSVMGLAWLSSALSPLVMTIALYTQFDGSNTMAMDPVFSIVRIVVSIVVGVIAGYLVALLSGFLPSRHESYTLYNAGFAAGLVGFLVFSFMKSLGIGHDGPSHTYISDKDLLLGACLVIALLYLLICGLVLIKKSGGRLLVPGRSKGDFVDKFGFGTSLVNMALCGALCLVYFALTTTGHIHGPFFACTLTVVGFAANGITIRGMIPIMAGVYLTSFITGGVRGALGGGSFLESGLAYVGSKSILISAVFGCGLAPVVYAHGAVIGFLAAMVHIVLVVNTGALHGWLDLYNNGFCSGLVATFFVPMLVQLLQPFKKKKKADLYQPDIKVMDAEEALRLLKEGNQRYMENRLLDKADYAERRKVLADGQKPFAIVLCCADSRVAPEIFFDQRLGDLFVVRNAGNVVDETVLGSIEYGVEHLESPLVVVVGHSSCGAVTAACEGVELPDEIQFIVDKIAPSIKGKKNIDEVIHVHAQKMAEQIRANEIIKQFGTRVEAAYYNIVTGEVHWL